MNRSLPRLLAPFALAGALALGASGACANQVVILTSGNRIEVESALPVGDDGYQLRLVGGGTVTLPSAAIRRVSNAAADMPRESSPMIASPSGRWQPGAATGSSDRTIPDGIPADAIRTGPGKLELADALAGPRLSPVSATLGGPVAFAPKSEGGVGTNAAAASRSITQQARPRSVASNPLQGGFRRAGSPSGAGLGLPRANPGGGDPGKGAGLPRLGH